MLTENEFFQKLESRGISLTIQQKRAVVHNQGPLLLLAVPGAGKTMVLTARLAYLILVKNVAPHLILCLTFGRAAAKEMRERFVKNFGAMAGVPTAGQGGIHFSTIHSFAYEVIRSAFQQKNIRFQLIEEQSGSAGKSGVLRRIYEKYNGSVITDDQLDDLQNTICYVKNSFCRPDKIKDSDIRNFARIYNDYETYKQNSRPRLIDYDDMLSLAFQELKENPEFLEKYRKRYDYILTDESQDTSLLQHKIIELIVKPKRNIFVVGDDDQSIFGFRAAEPNYLLEFKQAYPGAEIFRMEQNFRSTQQIVAVSCAFIRSNKRRFDKKMFTENSKGDELQIHQFEGIFEQNQFLIDQLKTPKDWAKVGVLYRNNLSAVCLADALERAKIPFYLRESGKQRFFSHWAVKDILNFLRFSFNDKSLRVFEKIWSKLNCPIRKQDLEWLTQQPTERSIFDTLAERPGVSSRQRSKYFELKKRFKELNTLTPVKALPYIRDQLDYDKSRKRICESLGFSGDYVGSLLDVLSVIAQKERTIVEFAKRLKYLEERMRTSYRFKNSNAVTLTTIHSAKGLEWENVYLMDLVEGVIPERETIKAEQNGRKELLEEERRLFYVGMTRARKHLTLCFPNYYHQKKVKPSRFVREVELVMQGKDPQTAISQDIFDLPGGCLTGVAIQHKAFGEGIIVKDDGKVIEVHFKNGSQRSFLKDICVRQKLIWADSSSLRAGRNDFDIQKTSEF